MENFIILIILIVLVGSACRYIWKAKKSGRKCIGCPASGSASCTCGHHPSQTKNDKIK